MPSHTDPNLLRPAYVMDDPSEERRERLPPEDDDERVLRACRERMVVVLADGSLGVAS